MNFRDLVFILLLTDALVGNSQRQSWQDHTVFRINKEEAHATLFPYETREAAIEDNEKSSRWYRSLNGLWKFHFAVKPADKPHNFFEPTFNTDHWNDIRVPANWEVEGYDHPIYLDEKYPFDTKWPDVPQDYNPVGSYRREFDFPDFWSDREVFLHLGACNSGVTVWLNGKEVGYSEDSKTPAEFNVTKFIEPGSNTLALQILRWSDGSYLESQDMLRMSGIERDVFLFASPREYIDDFFTIANLDDQYRNGLLSIRAKVKIPTTPRKLSLQAELLDDINEKCTIWKQELPILSKKGEQELRFNSEIDKVRQWTAEMPQLYTLLLSLLDERGELIEVVSAKVGFRRVEMRDGQLLVNGKAITIRGVNRHEVNSITGHVVSRELMERDAELMKQANVNAVRTSHYPNDPYWYKLMDKYGFYIVDEANIESQPLAGSPETNISSDMSWYAAHHDRVNNMFQRDKNHPSVIVWSMGNESGKGLIFDSLYHWLHRSDPTRLVAYEPAKLEPYTDIFSPMYARIPRLIEYAESKPDRPLIMCEYAHMMGNSGGNLKDYWEVIDKYPVLQGGFIWVWTDQGLQYINHKGLPFTAYGHDYHPDLPTDGNFVNNGILDGLREPHPHYYEVRKIYQPVKFEMAIPTASQVSIINKYDFISLDHLNIHWSLLEDGIEISAGSLGKVDIPAGKSALVRVPFTLPEQRDHEYYLILRAVTNKPQSCLPIGFEVAWNQFQLTDGFPTYKSPAKTESPMLKTSKKDYEVTGKNFSLVFSKADGSMTDFTYRGRKLMLSGAGPNFWRPPTDNDLGTKMHQWGAVWKNSNLNKKLISCDARQKDQKVIVTTVYSFPDTGSRVKIEYSVDGTGSIRVAYSFEPGNESLPDIPRVGLQLKVPQRLQYMSWYGRGPHETYWDRKESGKIGIHKGLVWDQMHKYPRPQETGNKSDVRWMTLTDEAGVGLRIIGDTLLSSSAWQLDQEDLDFVPASAGEESASGLVPNTSKHGADLFPRDFIVWNVDLLQMGVGGDNSWGAPVHEEYRIKVKPYRYSFTLQPVEPNE